MGGFHKLSPCLFLTRSRIFASCTCILLPSVTLTRGGGLGKSEAPVCFRLVSHHITAPLGHTSPSQTVRLRVAEETRKPKQCRRFDVWLYPPKEQTSCSSCGGACLILHGWLQKSTSFDADSLINWWKELVLLARQQPSSGIVHG